MNDDQTLDAARTAWFEVMRTATSLMQKRDLHGAALQIEGFLSANTNPDLRSEALGFRAHFKEEMGDVSSAEADLTAARALIGPTYARYVCELRLGRLCQKQRRDEEAASWYRNALQTCLEGPGISAGSALGEVVGAAKDVGSLTPDDRLLCTRAIERSWSVLRFAGKPDLSDLVSAISAIKSGEANPPRRS